ncbi:MAG: ribulose-phosphate 3-epimerase [Candidatus Azambacteria bacterium]|nr:ribulose-phosphate 3-epimerase [Candidatus Azambacteria bacterium]
MNNTPYKLAASLICSNMLDVAADIRSLEEGGIDYIHVDVMDGSFVPRLGVHPEMVRAVRTITNIPIDVHMMIDNPDLFVPDFIKAGGNIIIVHAESTKHLHRTIKMIRDMGARAGVALNPGTTLHVLDYVLDDIDLVMLMAINPGIVGHKLIPRTLDKISELKEKVASRSDMIIAIDGGVNPESAPQMIKRGANFLVCGSSMIFKPDSAVGENIKEVRSNIDRALQEMN